MIQTDQLTNDPAQLKKIIDQQTDVITEVNGIMRYSLPIRTG